MTYYGLLQRFVIRDAIMSLADFSEGVNIQALVYKLHVNIIIIQHIYFYDASTYTQAKSFIRATNIT